MVSGLSLRTRGFAALMACVYGAALVVSAPAHSVPSAQVAGSAGSGSGRGPEIHHSEVVVQGAGFTGQGLLILLGGGVHVDGDTDGDLDVGESIDYHFTLFNAGQSALSGIALSDSFGAVACPATTLAPGAHMECTTTYLITAADETNGSVLNQATATATDASASPVSAFDSVLITDFGGAADIRVFKSPDLFSDADGSMTLSAGDVVRYTFAVKNSGGEALTSVTLTEPDPTLIDGPITCAPTTLGAAAFTGNGSGALAATDVIICTADHTVTAAEVGAGAVTNDVEVAAQAPIAGAVVGTGSSLVVVPPVSLTLAKTLDAGGPIAEAGEILTYRLRITALSASGRTFPAGTIVETVPVGTQHAAGDDFTCAAITAGSSCTNTADLVVPDGGSADLLFRVLVLPAVAGQASIDNTVLPPPDTGCDPVADCSESTPLRNQADLSVVKTGPPVILRGSTLTFTIVVRNIGPDAAINARLEDPTPPGLIFVSTSGACSGPFPCALGDVAAGDTRTLTASYDVPANYAGSDTIINTVTVFSDSDDPTPGDSSSSSSVLVPSGGPLPVNPLLVPVDARWALLLMVAVVLLIGGRGLRSMR